MTSRTVLASTLVLAMTGCRPDLPAATRALASPDPQQREQAAAVLRQAYQRDPVAFGDPGEAYWLDRFKVIDGKKDTEVREILGVYETEGTVAGGGGATENIRLDRFWCAALHVSTRDRTVVGHAPPRRCVKAVDVPAPAGYTGTWTTYFIHGGLHDSSDLVGGVMKRRREFHDNGTLRCEHTFVDGKRDGTFVWRYPDGTPEREESYRLGTQEGDQRWFYPNGKLREQDHWVDGKREGWSTSYDEAGTRTQCLRYTAGILAASGCSAE